MKFRKIIAALLCAAMTAGAAGVTGCRSNATAKDKGQIEDLMESYIEALNDLDSDSLLDLTNWDDDDKDYEAVEELLDLEKYENWYGKG